MSVPYNGSVARVSFGPVSYARVRRWLADHPFDVLYQLGFRVTVNTDNRLMSNTTLTKELALLAGTFGYDLDDLAAFQINAALGSFLPLEDREEIIAMITSGYAEA